MSDYIKRDNAIENIDELYFSDKDDHDRTREAIKRLSSADVRENVRGEWLPHIIDGNVWSIDKDTCSVCKETFYQISETGCVWNFCPNCGADMRSKS